MFYAHQCPETGRWFVCAEGVDHNLCEVFAWGFLPAHELAQAIAGSMNDTMNNTPKLPKEELWTSQK